jgi:hypothetical protein
LTILKAEGGIVVGIKVHESFPEEGHPQSIAGLEGLALEGVPQETNSRSEISLLRVLDKQGCHAGRRAGGENLDCTENRLHTRGRSTRVENIQPSPVLQTIQA